MRRLQLPPSHCRGLGGRGEGTVASAAAACQYGLPRLTVTVLLLSCVWCHDGKGASYKLRRPSGGAWLDAGSTVRAQPLGKHGFAPFGLPLHAVHLHR